MLTALVLVVGAFIVALIVLRTTHPLPGRPPATPSKATPPSVGNKLGAVLMPEADAHPGLSGVGALVDGRDALAARVVLARTVQASIDVQYYIWQRMLQCRVTACHRWRLRAARADAPGRRPQGRQQSLLAGAFGLG
jgi:phosphatidylserine/phosphatidylglycerophosphate/cardiolipin synthase-like enzyme